MQTWMVEADIYRLTKAMAEASKEERTKLSQHLRRAQAQLMTLRQQAVGAETGPSA